jgi:hypothetical protein
MEPAIRQQPRVADPAYKAVQAQPDEPEIPDWEIKLGKTIFYVTCATALWFFYWLNGIQCPC